MVMSLNFNELIENEACKCYVYLLFYIKATGMISTNQAQDVYKLSLTRSDMMFLKIFMSAAYKRLFVSDKISICNCSFNQYVEQ